MVDDLFKLLVFLFFEFGLWRSRPIYEYDSSFSAPAAIIIMMMMMIPEIGSIIYTDDGRGDRRYNLY